MLRARVAQQAPPANGEVDLFLGAGQSHILGGWDRDELLAPIPFRRHWHHYQGVEAPGAYVWDKAGRLNWLSMDLTDPNRSNEAHQWRPLTLGYSPQGQYPWEGGTIATDVRTWDMKFAHLWRMHTGRTAYIVRCGFGGTVMEPRVGGDPPNPWGWKTSLVGTPTASLTQVMMQSYWAPALTALLAAQNGQRNQIRLRGVIWCQGSSDALEAPNIPLYKQHTLDFIDFVSNIIAPGEGAQVPWLLLGSPRGNGPLLPGIDSIRADQKEIGDERANVTYADAISCQIGEDGIHMNTKGNDQLGALIFRHVKEFVGYRGPHGEDYAA